MRAQPANQAPKAGLQERRELTARLRPAPPERWLEFNRASVDQVPAVEGVFILTDPDKRPIVIKGTTNIQAELLEKIESGPDARFFVWEEDRMYTKRESELIQQHLGQYGELPGGGDDELDDLF